MELAGHVRKHGPLCDSVRLGSRTQSAPQPDLTTSERGRSIEGKLKRVKGKTVFIESVFIMLEVGVHNA